MAEPTKKPLTFKQDMLKLNVDYTININPDNIHQYNTETCKHSKCDRLYYVCRYIQNSHMRKLMKHTKYFIAPEISSPKQDNMKGITRIHFHGIIRFTDMIGIKIWYYYVLNELKAISMVELDTIDNIATRKNYCYKNSHVMKQLCDMEDLPYPLTHETGMIKSRIETL